MKRVLALVFLPLLLTVTGCSMLGGSDWEQVTATYDSGPEASGDYTLVVTPTEVVYTLEGDATTHELPNGVWTALTAGLSALGDHSSEACPDGQLLTIQAVAGGEVKQTFETSSCDAGESLGQAKALIEQLLSRLK